jgi:hypothetical protein
LLKILRIVFGLIGLIFAVYGLITNKSVGMTYMFFFLGAMFFVMGISEFQKKRKRAGFISIVVSVLTFLCHYKVSYLTSNVALFY